MSKTPRPSKSFSSSNQFQSRAKTPQPRTSSRDHDEPTPAFAAAAVAAPTYTPMSFSAGNDAPLPPLIKGRPSNHSSGHESAGKSTKDEESKENDNLFSTKHSHHGGAKRNPADPLRAAAESNKKQRRVSVPNKKNNTDELESGDGESSNKSHHSIQRLHNRSIYLGQNHVGCIESISLTDIRISLPNGMKGIMKLNDINDGISQRIQQSITGGNNNDNSNNNNNTNKPSKQQQRKNSKIDVSSHLKILNEYFIPGQQIICSVIDIQSSPKFTVKLSMKPVNIHSRLTSAHMNEGMLVSSYIKSVEEKGYLLDISVSDAEIEAFLPFADCPVNEIRSLSGLSPLADGELFSVGQPLECVITKAKDRAITVTAIPKRVQFHEWKNSRDSLEFHHLHPGFLTEFLITDINSNGLIGTFLHYFTGSIDLIHLNHRLLSNWSEQYEINQKLKVRLLYINIPNKCAAMTELSHLIHYEPIKFLPKEIYSIGKKIEESKVIRVESLMGLFLEPVYNNNSDSTSIIEEIKDDKKSSNKKSTMNNNDKEKSASSSSTSSVLLFSHPSQLSDHEVSSIIKQFPLNSIHSSRITGINSLEGFLQVSLQSSILSLSVVSYHEIQPAQFIDGEIVSIKDNGLVIKITPKIVGFIPIHQLNDIGTMNDINKYYELKQSIHCRVLNINPRDRELICTMKKSLLKLTDQQLITSWDNNTSANLQPNIILNGFISSINDQNGIWIEFFQRIRGFISLLDCRKNGFITGNQLISSIYTKGQAVKVKVLSVKPNEKKLLLSFNTKSTPEENNNTNNTDSTTTNNNKTTKNSLQVGSLVNGKIIKIQYIPPKKLNNNKKPTLFSVEQEIFGNYNNESMNENENNDNEEKTNNNNSNTTTDKLFDACNTFIYISIDGHSNIIEARLSASHLSDHLSLAESTLKSHRVGDIMNDLLVLSLSSDSKYAVLSLKSALKEHRNSIPKSIQSIEVNQIYYGFIRNLDENSGLFIGFLGKLIAFIPRPLLQLHKLSSSNNSLLSSEYSIDQTIKCKILSVDKESGRISATINPSELNEGNDNNNIQRIDDGKFLLSYFHQLDHILELHNKNNKNSITPIDWNLLTPGLHYPNSTIDFVKQNVGVFFTNYANIKGMSAIATPFHSFQVSKSGKNNNKENNTMKNNNSLIEYKKGEIHSTCILDVNKFKNIVDVSLKPELNNIITNNNNNNKSANKKKSKTSSTPTADANSIPFPAVGSTVRGKIQLIKSKYLVLTLPEFHHRPVNVPTGLWNYSSNPHSLYKMGQELDVFITNIPENNNHRILGLIDLPSAIESLKKKISSPFYDKSLFKVYDIQPGKFVLVRIESIDKSWINVSFGEKLPYIHATIHVSQLVELKATPAAATVNVVNEKKENNKSAKKSAKKSIKTDSTDTAIITNPIELIDSFPLKPYENKIGQLIKAKVLSVNKRVHGGQTGNNNNKDKDNENNNNLRLNVSLTIRPSELQSEGISSSNSANQSIDINTLSVGQSISGIVKNIDIEQNTIFLTLGPHMHGRIKGFDISDSLDILNHLNDHYKVGQIIQCFIRSIDINQRFVELSKFPIPMNNKTNNKSGVNAAAINNDSASVIQLGDIVRGRIMKYNPPFGLLVELSNHRIARIHITDLFDEFPKNPLLKYHLGQLIEGKVMELKKEENHSILVENEESEESSEENNNSKTKKSKKNSVAAKKSSSSIQQQENSNGDIKEYIGISLRNSHVKGTSPESSEFVEIPDSADISSLSIGDKIQGYVKRTDSKGSFIFLSRSLIGRVLLKNLSDGFVQSPEKKFPMGKRVIGRILDIDIENHRIELTLKKSQLNGLVKEKTYSDYSVNDIVYGEITQIKKFGVFIRIDSTNLSGLCHISEISKKFVTGLLSYYNIGDRVRAKILKIDGDNKKMSFGMKSEYFEGMPEEEQEENSDEEEDEDAGEDSDELMAGLSDDDDDAAVKEKSSKKRKRADRDSDSDDSDDLAAAEQSKKAAKSTPVSAKSKQPAAAVATPRSTRSRAADADFDSAEALPITSLSAFKIGFEFDTKQTNAGDNDSDKESNENAEQSDDDEADGSSKKLSKRAKSAVKKAAQRELISLESSLLDSDRPPETASDFDRLVLANPNSSFLWIQFVNFYISSSEFDSARSICQRALKTINYRELKEKLNVYIAYLALEIQFGTQEQFDSIYEKAIQSNDKELIIAKVAEIYLNNNQLEKSKEYYELLIKKYPGRIENWILYGNQLYKFFHQPVNGRLLLTKALKSINEKGVLTSLHSGNKSGNINHIQINQSIELIIKFMKFERDFGQPERARTLLDNCLLNYPKRIDIWNIYIDLEEKLLKNQMNNTNNNNNNHTDKNNQMKPIRNLLNRIIENKSIINEKNMKLLLKSLIKIEKEFGDEIHIEKIKIHAKEYVEWKLEQKILKMKQNNNNNNEDNDDNEDNENEEENMED